MAVAEEGDGNEDEDEDEDEEGLMPVAKAKLSNATTTWGRGSVGAAVRPEARFPLW